MAKINPNLQKLLNIVNETKEPPNKEKNKKFNVGKALADMQEYLDNTPEKQNKFIQVLTTAKDKNTGKKIKGRGLVIYARRIQTINNLIKLIKDKEIGIECKKITGKEKASKRQEIEKWFKEDSSNKVVFISDAGGASLNLNPTNYLCLYTIPTDSRKFNQIIGRIARQFGKYSEFYIISIVVKGTLDEYNSELLSSKSSIDTDLLGANTIPKKKNSKFNLSIFKRLRAQTLWRFRQREKLKKKKTC